MGKLFRLFVVAASLSFSFANTRRSWAQTAATQALPAYMNIIVGNAAPATKSEVAQQNVLDLDLAMFGIYDDAQAKFQKTFLAQHPVIMALFSGQGGKLTLYRPQQGTLGSPAGSNSLPGLQISGACGSGVYSS
jgi:hypothetical protein